MSTNAYILKKISKNTYIGVYLHWGEDHAAEMLLKNYKDPAKIDRIIERGAISVLGKGIGSKHSFDTRDNYKSTTFYIRDGERPKLTNLPETFHGELKDLRNIVGVERVYVWEYGKWWMFSSEYNGELSKYRGVMYG